MKAAAVTCVALLGCGASGTGGLGIDAANAPCIDTVLRSGTTYKYGSTGNGPLGSAEACVVGPTDCTTADGTGNYTLCVPASSDYGVRFSSIGHETVVYLYDDAYSGPLGSEQGDDGFVATLWAQTGAHFPPTSHSLLWIGVGGPVGPLANARVAIAPNVGKVTYGDPAQVASSTLTATSSSGTAFVGISRPESTTSP